jgi:hypothetical protein
MRHIRTRSVIRSPCRGLNLALISPKAAAFGKGGVQMLVQLAILVMMVAVAAGSMMIM